MEERIRKMLPEIDWIRDETLREQVVAVYADALGQGGWEPEDMKDIPFSLLIEGNPISLLDHVRGVTRVARAAMEAFNENYAPLNAAFTLNSDELMAGALLHDVGKLIEYERDENGKVVKSELGRNLRHPFTGTALALRRGISSRIAHMIANHSKEGDGTQRTPEGVMINKADFINFEIIKAFLEQ